MDRDRRGEGDRRGAVRIIYIHSKARQNSQRDETNQETGAGDGVNNERSGVLYAADGLLLLGVCHDTGNEGEGE